MERLRAFTEMSKLQGLLMNVIAKNMSTEGIGALQDVFDALVGCSTFHFCQASVCCPALAQSSLRTEDITAAHVRKSESLLS